MSTDLFSKQATTYSQFRPQYPQELYQFLAECCKEKELAWDCATGNGQAACDLAKYFKKMIATDISEKQISNATKAPNIEYLVLKAEEPLPVKNGSIDLITVAQAIHWFDLDIFYNEAKRVLKPGGIMATWAYAFHSPIETQIDKILYEFCLETLGPYWKENVKWVWNKYKDLKFPFEEIKTPVITMNVNWNLDDLLGYFRSWSATQLYIDQHHEDPTVKLKEKLIPLWGDSQKTKKLEWELALRVGKLKA